MKLNVYHSDKEKKKNIEKEVNGKNVEVVDEVQKYSIVESKPQNILVKKDGNIVQIKISDIYSVETVGRDNFVYTNNDEFKMDLTLSNFIEIYYSYNFFRVSRSCIVNLDYIVAMKPTYNMKMKIRLGNDSDKYVTRGYLNVFRERIGMWGAWWIKC